MAANADVVFRVGANVQDALAGLKQAQKAVDDLGKTQPQTGALSAWSRLGAAITSPMSQIGGLRGALTEAGGAIKGLAGTTAGLATGFGAVAAGAGVAAAALNPIFERAQRIEGMSRGFENLAGGVGEAASRMQALQDASGGTLNAMESMRLANQAMLLGVANSSEEMAELTRIARALGTTMGLDTANALESLTTGIGRQSKLWLDNLGIIIDVDREYAAYAATVGKSADKLTEAERKQVFLNAALREGRELADRTGEAAVTNAQQWSVLKNRFEDTKNILSEMIAEGLGPAVGALNSLLRPVADLAAGFSEIRNQAIAAALGVADFSAEAANKFSGSAMGKVAELAEERGAVAGRIRELQGLAEKQAAEVQRLESLGSRIDPSYLASVKQAFTETNAEISRQAENLVALTVRHEEARKAVDGMTAAERMAGSAASEESKRAAAAADDKAKASDDASEAAEKEREAIREVLKMVDATAASTARKRAEIEGMDLALDREIGLYDELDAALTSAEGALFDLYNTGKIGADQYQAKLDSLIGAHEQLREETSGARLDAFLSERASAIASGEGITDAMSVDTGTGAAVQSETDAAMRDAAAEQDALAEQRFQRELELLELGYSRTEAEAILTEEILRQGAAYDELAARMERAQRIGESRKEWLSAASQGMQMMTQAASQLGAGLMRMALTGEGSFKQMAQAALQGLAIESAGRAVFETAQGLAALAMSALGHPTAGASAALHFKSAAMFGVMAAGFGALSAAAGQPGGGSGGESASEGGGSSISGGTDTFRRDVEEGQRMPAVTVQFTGNGIIAGTTPEAFAQSITPFIQDTVRDMAGRSGSVRP